VSQQFESVVAPAPLAQSPVDLVIIAWSMDELASVVRCTELGAEGYLTKPVSPVLLQARINASAA
jgi:DNA-binding response OmpR family regulator